MQTELKTHPLTEAQEETVQTILQGPQDNQVVLETQQVYLDTVQILALEPVQLLELVEF